MSEQTTLDQLSINTIRTLAMDGVQKANSGHPGMPMGMAPAAYVVWTRLLRHNPKNPRWANRDRFVLSAGHGSMLLYSLLYLTGYGDYPLDQLKQFRQWGSLTPGHPEVELSTAIETTTGPLGQGFANGVGMAIGANYLAAYFNRDGHELFDYHIYAIVSDGDLMEGVSSEAASLAGHLKLGRLIYLYDDNHISIDGSTNLAFTEDRAKRFEAYGWHVQTVTDANDVTALEAAIKAAQADARPSIICVKSVIGFGSPNKAGTSKAHGEPLGADEIKLTKQNLGWPSEEPFFVPEEALNNFRQCVTRGAQFENDWQAKFDAYAQAHPELAAELNTWLSGELPAGWQDALPVFPADKPMATREASGKALNAFAAKLPMLIGGSADLRPSNNTWIDGSESFQASSPHGRNFHFGVREHAMGSVMNGIARTHPLIPFGGTFMIFYDYMRPPVRLAAMMGLGTIYVYTHDSIGLGEDGPTHQPIEQLAGMRAVPGLTLIRPADANETAVAWRVAIAQRHSPTALALTRQKLPTFDRTKYASAEGLTKGAYVMSDSPTGKLDVILIGTGSEVAVAVEAQDALAQAGIGARVVSLPSWELFDAQPQAYRDEVLPPTVTARVAIETGVSFGWERYVGSGGVVIGMDRFGASAPVQVLMEKFGFTAGNVVAKVKGLLGK
ncbi:MAG: transketolase [Acidobacteria bacterium]|nr:transketolase [Acidobacteriota bacterium]MBI3421841.1 transketolase [Acidobacteriota bacterium]